jgi:hypothetical protein
VSRVSQTMITPAWSWPNLTKRNAVARNAAANGFLAWVEVGASERRCHPMHKHAITLRGEHTGADGLTERAVAEILLDHGHGPIAESEKHDHIMSLVFAVSGQTVTLRSS